MFITKYIAIEPMVAEINWTLENLNKEYGKIIVTYKICSCRNKMNITEWNKIAIKYVSCDYITCS